jgi:hypothetical protein
MADEGGEQQKKSKPMTYASKHEQLVISLCRFDGTGLSFGFKTSTHLIWQAALVGRKNS